MLDSALLKTNFVGRDGFVWWIGRVADPDVWRNQATDTDAGWAFRCKVRIIGYHPFDDSELTDEDLPWAHVLVDATSGSGQGTFGESSRMVGGETVFGFFMDGEEGQQPVVFGALARTVNSKGPQNAAVAEGAIAAESGAWGVASGRKGSGSGQTTLPLSENAPAGTPSDNASNRVGSEQSVNVTNRQTGESEKKTESSAGLEGISKARKADQTFADISLGPHGFSNGCTNDALSDITHAIGSFLKTVNSLTEYAGAYVDSANNLLADIEKIVNKASRLVTGAVKLIINSIRDKVLGLLGKRFRDFVGLIVPEPQKSPVVNAFKRIMDILFCVLEQLGIDLFDSLKKMFKDMIGKALNSSVCAVEQAVGAVMADVNDKIKAGTKPIIDGLDWLTGAMDGMGGLLSKVQSYIDMLMSFLACDSLQCKEYQDWTQGSGLSAKPATKMSSVLDNIDIIDKLDVAAGSPLEERFSLLSLLNGDVADFFDCNEKTNNPKTQDDLGNSIPPGFTWPECIPPKIEVHGNGSKTAALLPIISGLDGSILTMEILEKGWGYTNPPTISIIDKTNHGGGAIAEAILDGNGSIVDIYMMANGSGYCPSTNVVPPKYPVTEGPGAGTTTGIGTDGLSLDTVPPYITFTTPADDAVGVQTGVSLSMTFNEPIVKGQGHITIMESNSNVIHEKIPVPDNDRISFLSDRIIEVNPDKDLQFDTEYHIMMSEGSFFDLTGNQFVGIALTDTYNFTTRGVAGIGSQAVGIVTDLRPVRPGIGYTSGDMGIVGKCTFDLLLTPAGSIVGVTNIACKDKHNQSPKVSINTKTGRGAQLIPIINYSPDYVSDIGEKPDGTGPILVVDVVNCVGKPLTGSGVS